jgi:hypothetical protein
MVSNVVGMTATTTMGLSAIGVIKSMLP